MEALLRRRLIYKTELDTSASEFIPDATNGLVPASDLSLEELQVHLEEVDRKRTAFLNVQEAIESKVKNEDVADTLLEHKRLESTFISLKATIRAAINQRNATAPQMMLGHAELPTVTVQLPKITIPTFSGKYSEWPSFCDLFCSLVHDKQNLSGVQKLQYLKSALKDEPLRIIQVFQVTEANYEEAWKRLKERYYNPRLIILAHLRAIAHAQALSSESANGLRKLLDIFQDNLSALSALGQPTREWSSLLVFLLGEKLDPESKKQWELSLKGTNMPAFADLCSFLEVRSRALEAAGPLVKSKPSPFESTAHQKKPYQPKPVRPVMHTFITNETSCGVCDGAHSIYKCPLFMNTGPSERSELARSRRLCFNCLGTKHSADACKSTHVCKECKQKHHTLLHFNSVRSTVPAQTLFAKDSHFQVLLSTVLLNIEDEDGRFFPCRALLDSGSQSSFVTTAFVSQLKLSKRPYITQIHGLGSSTKARAQGLVTLRLHSRHSSFNMTTEAVVLNHITNNIPASTIETTTWSYLKNLPLADPTFHLPGAVDALLGADVFAHVLSGQRVQEPRGPTAFKTEFGWVLSGNCKVPAVSIPSVSSCLAVIGDLHQQLRRFWEVEEPPELPPLSAEEAACELHFITSHKRSSSGAYITELPLKPEIHNLGDSRARAVQQLISLERRLVNDPSLRQDYVTFMQEYERLHHMEPVSPDPENPCFYIPHHAVLKPDSSTTKLRVVFNASARSTSGTSLNDCLMVGTQLQPTLVELILRFRTHKIPLMADVEKMYRQVQVAPHHRKYQRIVWRESPDQPIRDFQLTTVTYGTASAPFVAVRVLKQLADDEGHRFPQAASVLKSDFYIDDLVSGASSVEEAATLKVQLKQLLALGGFNLRKWISTSPVATDDQTSADPAPAVVTKTLGVGWLPPSDEFFVTCAPVGNSRFTKRSLLAEVAKLFDPLGWIAPIVLLGKLLIQRLWLLNSDWDDPVPDDVQFSWSEVCSQWHIVSNFRFPRFLHISSTSQVELHGFSDASERAFGAVVYLRCVDHTGSCKVSLLMAKTRVAPLKQLSVPRLELCGAVLLTRLIKFISQTLNLKDVATFAWTDSSVVLHWLSDTPRRWKTFVANRVAEIQGVIPVQHWRHIASQFNPADCCSRGATPLMLVNNPLWWFGPPWLAAAELPLPAVPESVPEGALEERPIIALVASEEPSSIQALISKCSSLPRLIRIFAYCLRFIAACRATHPRCPQLNISSEEFSASQSRLILQVQLLAFPKEVKALSSRSLVPSSSRLKSLHPFLDPGGLLRVGGRLDNSSIPYDRKHPLILPHDHHLSLLIVRDLHLRCLHAGPTLLLCTLRQQFWILRARSLVKSVVFQCLICFRAKGAASVQLMGALPVSRVEPARPFLRCGVDCAGPFLLRDRVRAGRPILVKSYVVLFICFVTKAIHLELCSSLSSDCFVAAFKRFCSRRGLPHDVFSDCGTNFVGAQDDITFSHPVVQSALHAFAVPKAIRWHFNPPSAPHMGGLWEAGVKSTKYHLQRVVGSTPLTFEELSTVLSEIEACLNSRPLCAITSDHDELEPLTPGHFLIGEPLSALPCRDYTVVADNRLATRWQLLQKLTQAFWSRWSTEYLSRLQQRPKWTTTSPNLQPGDLVLVKDEPLRPMCWPLARVSAVHPGRDSVVRVVSVVSRNKVFTRPVVKLCKLPLDCPATSVIPPN